MEKTLTQETTMEDSIIQTVESGLSQGLVFMGDRIIGFKFVGDGCKAMNTILALQLYDISVESHKALIPRFEAIAKPYDKDMW